MTIKIFTIYRNMVDQFCGKKQHHKQGHPVNPGYPDSDKCIINIRQPKNPLFVNILMSQDTKIYKIPVIKSAENGYSLKYRPLIKNHLVNMNNPQQPGEFDAVLGGNIPSTEYAAVLGGIEGIKLRLQNPDLNAKIAAMKQALNYGEQGLDLLIKCLNDKSWDVQNQAYIILNYIEEPRIKQILKQPNQEGLKLEQIEVVTVDKFGEIVQRQPRVARYFTENLGNGVTLEMAAIPGGTFIMGSPENEVGRWTNESPQHQVTVPAFFMAKYPLTQAQYEAIMWSKPAYFAYFKDDNGPVEKVSWNDAVAFCQKLSHKTGKNYKLPSEAQWEYACRAGTTTPFYFGETITPDLVNYNGNYTYASARKGRYLGQTTVVGSFPPNAFGLYDMYGNVWEWCEDDYEENYINAPIDGSALISTSAEKENKLLRGGSWYDDPIYCRSAYRSCYAGFYYNVGFRVVLSKT